MADDGRPDLIVTNFNRNFTGVSATAAAVTRRLASRLRLRLCGVPLPGLPEPISRLDALRISHRPANGRRFIVWHVRRNTEMQHALLARDVLRLPMKIVFTSAAQRRHSPWPRWLISRMDAVVATTELAATLVPNVRAVIPHGVDIDWFRPAEDRATAWQATGFPGRAGVATVGRIRPEKGTDRFVDSMIAALPGLPGTSALVIGAATSEFAAFEAGLKARVAAAGLSGRILFTGEISAERLREIYPALSLLVAPPRYEGYGMTVLEAMASGVPVVATEAGNFSVLIGEDAGVVLPQESPELAAAITSLLTDPERMEATARAGRVRAETLFSVEREAEALVRIYDELAGAG
jgi:mannosyltransferase